MPSSRGSSQPRDQIQVSTLWVDSLLSEPPGKSTHRQRIQRQCLNYKSRDHFDDPCIQYMFLVNTYINVCVCAVCLVAQSCPTLCDPMDCTLPGSSVHGDSPSKNTGVGCHALFQGIFPTQGSNQGLTALQILYRLSQKGSPRILEWVAYPFSRGIFPNQESNWGLLHCRWILYQLSYLGSPFQILSFVQRSQSPLKKWLILGLSQEKNN